MRCAIPISPTENKSQQSEAPTFPSLPDPLMDHSSGFDNNLDSAWPRLFDPAPLPFFQFAWGFRSTFEMHTFSTHLKSYAYSYSCLGDVKLSMPGMNL